MLYFRHKQIETATKKSLLSFFQSTETPLLISWLATTFFLIFPRENQSPLTSGPAGSLICEALAWTREVRVSHALRDVRSLNQHLSEQLCNHTMVEYSTRRLEQERTPLFFPWLAVLKQPQHVHS